MLCTQQLMFVNLLLMINKGCLGAVQACFLRMLEWLSGNGEKFFLNALQSSTNKSHINKQNIEVFSWCIMLLVNSHIVVFTWFQVWWLIKETCQMHLLVCGHDTIVQIDRWSFKKFCTVVFHIGYIYNVFFSIYFCQSC